MAASHVDEWFAQAQYDLETAEYMHEGGRHFYAVFMCHLAIEKALKGLAQSATNDLPPRTHNLVVLLQRARANPPEEIGRFIVSISEASVATRYPEELKVLQEDYTASAAETILSGTRKAIQWIEAQR